jgi:hypothetical protein
MRGYNTLKQYCEDYYLYTIAKKIDPGRDNNTLTSFMKKNMSDKLKNATKNFKELIKKNNYSTDDLKMIALHDSLKSIPNFDAYAKECFDSKFISEKHLKSILSSSAFRSGRLKRLYSFLPLRIQSKSQFLSFMRKRRAIQVVELEAIMKFVGNETWRKWFEELLTKGTISCENGRYFL